MIASSTSPRHFDMRTLSCFIVEDSPVIRDNLIETLEEMVPVRVCGTAESESDALDALRRQSPQPDLVIIDIFLKAGSGLGVLQQARQHRYGRHLVVLSNYASGDEIAAALHASASPSTSPRLCKASDSRASELVWKP